MAGHARDRPACPSGTQIPLPRQAGTRPGTRPPAGAPVQIRPAGGDRPDRTGWVLSLRRHSRWPRFLGFSPRSSDAGLMCVCVLEPVVPLSPLCTLQPPPILLHPEAGGLLSQYSHLRKLNEDESWGRGKPTGQPRSRRPRGKVIQKRSTALPAPREAGRAPSGGGRRRWRGPPGDPRAPSAAGQPAGWGTGRGLRDQK